MLVAGPRSNGLELCSQRVGVAPVFVSGTMVSELATWVWVCLFKLALLDFGVHGGFTTYYLDPKPFIKALLYENGCQIIVGVED